MKPVQAVIRWYRRVLPVPGLTLGFIMFFAVTEAICIMLMNWQAAVGDVFAPFNPIGGPVCLLAAAVYGVYRVVYFHPLWRPHYRRWLQASPWTIGCPLPDGPVLLSPQDLIPLALLTAGSLRVPDCEWFVVPILFCGVWSLFSLTTFALVGPGWLAYVMLLCIGGVLRTSLLHTEMAVGLGIVVVLSAQIGHYLSLRTFPEWDLTWNEKHGVDAFLTSNTEAIAELQQQKVLGWPFEQLSPDVQNLRVLLTIPQGLLLALMLAWQFDSLVHVLGDAARRPLPFAPLGMIVTMAGTAASVIRGGMYVSGHAPPISLFGRLKTGRWIIPGYDYAFIAPLLVFIVSTVGTAVVAHMPGPPSMLASGLLFLIVFLVTTMPPDLNDFHLVGNHRIVPDLKQRTSPFLTRD